MNNSSLPPADDSSDQAASEFEKFLRALAHELRSPLSNLQGFNRELKRDFAELSRHLETSSSLPKPLRDIYQEDIPTSLKQLEQSTDRVGLLISEALKYFKVCRRVPLLERVDLVKVFQAMQSVLADRFKESNAQLQYPQKIPAIQGDFDFCCLVFRALLENALDHCQKGHPLAVEVEIEKKGDLVRVGIKDNGVGIPATLTDRIFEPFYRGGSNSLQRAGMGLTMARKLMELQGGQLTLETQSRGNLFWADFKAA